MVRSFPFQRGVIACVLAFLMVVDVVAAADGTPASADRPATQRKSARTGKPPAKAPARPAAAVALPRAVTQVEGISQYVLANGLEVLLLPDPSKATFTVNVVYKVGSRYESYGESGMAHLLEHLMFKGTPRHPQIPAEMTARGAQSNGATSYDATNYIETLSVSEDNLDWAIGLEADRMVNSFIARRDLDSEMTVVRNEFESGENDPGTVLIQRVGSTAYLWHAYGRPTIGARSDIERVSIERLQAFYRQYYQPDNAVLVITGGFDPDMALRSITRHFGPVPKPTRQLFAPYTVEPAQDGERRVVLRRVGEVPLVMAAYHVPSGAEKDYAAIDMLAQIVGDDAPSGRLHQALVDSGRATRVFAFDLQLHDPGLLYFGAEVAKDGDSEAVLAEVDRIIEQFAQSGPTEAEMNRGRNALATTVERTLADSDRLASTLPQWIGMGDWRLLFQYRDHLAQVTADDVKRVAAAYLRRSNRTAGVFVPTRDADRVEIPGVPDVAALVRGYKGNPSVELGEAFDPSPRNIDARTIRKVLSNGARLALLPKRTRAASVNGVLQLRFGTAESLAGKAAVSELTAAMLMRGSTRYSRQDLQDRLDALKARVSISGSGNAVSVSFESSREALGEVLKLVAEILRNPAFPENELAQLQQQIIADSEQQKSDPHSAALLALRRHLSPYPASDVRYAATPDERSAAIAAVDVAAIKGFYANFYGASDARLGLVGDFDPDGVTHTMDDLFGLWTSPQAYSPLRSTFRERPPIDEKIRIADKANAVLFAETDFAMRDDHPDFPAMVLADYIFGGGFLHSRLATRVRQKEGISYSVGSDFSAHPRDALGSFMVYAIFAPQNEARLRAAIAEEWKRAVQQGFTEAEVRTARSGLLQSLRVSRVQDQTLAVQLANYLELQRTYAWDADIEARIEKLSAADVSAAFRRYADPSRASFVESGELGPAK